MTRMWRRRRRRRRRRRKTRRIANHLDRDE
jgi:hypothetical protein